MTDLATGASPTPNAGSGDAGAISTPAGATNTPAAATPTTNWYDGFDDDAKGYVQNKGWNNPSDLLGSYRNLEKLTGAGPDKLLQVPPTDDAEAWNKVYDRLGRPESPDKYNIQVPKEFGDPEFAKQAAGWFHELGLNARQAEALTNKWNEYVGGQMKATQEGYQTQVAQEAESLKKEWGAAYDQNISVAKTAARELGFDGPTVDKLEQALGFGGLMKLMHNIGSKVGEASFVSGDSGSAGRFGVMTPQAAQQQIQALRSDASFVKRYTEGDAEARSKLEQLHKWAYPDA